MPNTTAAAPTPAAPADETFARFAATLQATGLRDALAYLLCLTDLTRLVGLINAALHALVELARPGLVRLCGLLGQLLLSYLRR